jgi:hypothetical protein
MPDPRGHYLNDDMLHCIEVCFRLPKACLQTVPYCLQMGGHHAKPNHIRLMLDCAEVCQTSANFMLRGSDLHAYTCGRVCRSVRALRPRLRGHERERHTNGGLRRDVPVVRRIVPAHGGTGYAVGLDMATTEKERKRQGRSRAWRDRAAEVGRQILGALRGPTPCPSAPPAHAAANATRGSKSWPHPITARNFARSSRTSSSP